MVRKLLLLLLLTFTFGEISAQSAPNNFLTNATCAVGEDSYHEWTPYGTVNGKNAYRRINASIDGATFTPSYETEFNLWDINVGFQDVELASNNNGRIEWDFPLSEFANHEQRPVSS